MKKYLFIITLIYQSCVPPVAPTNSYDIASYDNINAYKYAKILNHSPRYAKTANHNNFLALIKRYLIPMLNEKGIIIIEPMEKVEPEIEKKLLKINLYYNANDVYSTSHTGIVQMFGNGSEVYQGKGVARHYHEAVKQSLVGFKKLYTGYNQDVGIASNNPCDDEKFISLIKKPFMETIFYSHQLPFKGISKKEYEYYKLKSKECDEYKTEKVKREIKIGEQIAQSMKKDKELKSQYDKSKDSNKAFWLGVGNEVLNILDEHQGNSGNNFNAGSSGSSYTCQYDDTKLKMTFETKVDTDSMRKFRKYKCTNIANTHEYWKRD